MKVLKFAPNLVSLILSGEKTTTWRLYDDKDITKGDQFIFVNKETGKEFAEAVIISVSTKPLTDLNDEDREGHEKFKNTEEMYSNYKRYYGDKVQIDTEVKVVKFRLTKK